VCAGSQLAGFWGDRTRSILMLTARTQVVDRVVGLKLGARIPSPSPLTPPSSWPASKRYCAACSEAMRSRCLSFRFGEVEVDFERAEVHKRGESVNLSAKELQLLRYLNHRGKIIPREERHRGRAHRLAAPEIRGSPAEPQVHQHAPGPRLPFHVVTADA
jgi:DNA-binding response OmpR family regulator